MAYNRWWLDNDMFAFQVGGGVVDNPGRYLALLPPINGANATSGTPYFPEAPGLPFRAYDFQVGFDYMPSQWVTWHVEFTQRGSDVPLFAGPGGMTPPGGNNGFPQIYACNDGSVRNRDPVKGMRERRRHVVSGSGQAGAPLDFRPDGEVIGRGHVVSISEIRGWAL